MIYEKYRTTFHFRDCEIGSRSNCLSVISIEIEGSSVEKIKQTAKELNVDWEKRITSSYLELFQNLKSNKNLNISNIVFSEFEGMHFTESDFIAA